MATRLRRRPLRRIGPQPPVWTTLRAIRPPHSPTTAGTTAVPVPVLTSMRLRYEVSQLARLLNESIERPIKC